MRHIIIALLSVLIFSSCASRRKATTVHIEKKDYSSLDIEKDSNVVASHSKKELIEIQSNQSGTIQSYVVLDSAGVAVIKPVTHTWTSQVSEAIKSDESSSLTISEAVQSTEVHQSELTAHHTEDKKTSSIMYPVYILGFILFCLLVICFLWVLFKKGSLGRFFMGFRTLFSSK
jgi:hypothetical protein